MLTWRCVSARGSLMDASRLAWSDCCVGPDAVRGVAGRAVAVGDDCGVVMSSHESPKSAVGWIVWAMVLVACMVALPIVWPFVILALIGYVAIAAFTSLVNPKWPGV